MFYLLFLFVLLSTQKPANEEVIIDSQFTFEEAIKGTEAPDSVIIQLCLLEVEYYSTDSKLHRGQIILHQSVKEDIIEIFQLIKQTKFPVKKVIPIVKYKWSDDASMEDNNTSAFCYRFIAGTTKLSKHSFGKAIDINPFFNPVVYPDGTISPKNAKYDKKAQGTFTEDSPIVQEFLKRGWRWGHNFSKYADNHHFDKAD
jgi:peptidoglycan LD-endopeptidase CwlK